MFSPKVRRNSCPEPSRTGASSVSRGARDCRGESEEAPDQFGAAQRGLDRVADERRLLAVWWACFFEKLQVAQHDREEIVEIMRYSTGKLADRLHLLAC